MSGGGGITEGIVEDACLAYLQAIGYTTLPGPAIAPEGPTPERTSWEQVLLLRRLREAIARINPDLPSSAVDQVVARLQRAESQSELSENERFHRLLVEGVPVEHRVDGQVRTSLAWVIDWVRPERNDWLAVNQFTVIGAKKRRPDVVVFVNGTRSGCSS